MQSAIEKKELPFIKFEKVSYVYMEGSPFETIALKDVDLEIMPGEFLGVIGHTGSGKTTLVQHINALLKPTSGKVIIKGVETSTEKSKLNALRKTVGLVFQYPEYQLFEESVVKDVAYGPKNLGMGKEEIERRVAAALSHVGLDIDEVGDKSPFELSGGQKRRAAFAGVLAMEPDILILDEPTAGLDPKGRKEVLELLVKLNKEENMTVIMISHYMDEIAAVCSKVLVMDKGEVSMFDAPREVFSHYEELKSLGLDVPYTLNLVQQMKSRGVNIKGTPLTLDEMYASIAAAKEGKNA
ncbi:MAG: energy-coupling factor transporter ATPase [Clostridia bacterium]|nr:energy-coupling factor transporter ATPase [Clostridia bacterium]